MKVNEKLIDFFKENKKYIIILGFIIVTVSSLALRCLFIKEESHDMTDFLYEWFAIIKENGGFNAVKLDIGDYNVPYVMIIALLTYLPIHPIVSIKAVSIIFDYVLATACVKLIKAVLGDRYKSQIGLLVYTLIIFLPTVVLNSSCWGQCDSIYVSFMIISLTYLLKEKYIRSFIFLGISFAFKLQFIFILPLYVLYYLSKRKFRKIYYFLLIPLTNAIMCLPAVILGKSISSCINVYFHQAIEYGSFICMNFPGIYNLFLEIPRNYLIPTPNEYLGKIMIGIMGLIFFVAALYVLVKKVKFNKELIIETALWSILVATFLLPHMHDRYMFAADVISVIYCIIKGKRKIYVPICISLCSLLVYSRVLTTEYYGTEPLFIASAIIFALLVVLNISLWKNLKKGTKETKLIEEISTSKE